MQCYKKHETGTMNLAVSNENLIPEGGALTPPRLPDIRSICVISASYYPFIGL